MSDQYGGRGLVLGVLLVALLACEDDATDPELEEMAPALQPLTAPENLVSNIEILYNDKVRTATERRIEYEKLLAPPPGCDTCQAFGFEFLTPDEAGTPDAWGRDQEIQATANIFRAQEDGRIREMTLQFELLPAEDLLGDPERPGWKEVFITNIHLRLLTAPQDGFEVLGDQARFQLYPAQGRWWIGWWNDLGMPRPLSSPIAVERTNWGRIKSSYY